MDTIITIQGFIKHKIETDTLMHLSPRRDSSGTGMGQSLKRAIQDITKVWNMPV